MIQLLIEDGILLKPYTLPWTKTGYKRPHGWTPDRDEWVTARAAEIVKANDAIPQEIALQQAEVQRGHELYSRKLPWRGWAPVGVSKEDRKLREAYRELFIEMNPEYKNDSVPNVRMTERAKWVPDGRYVLRNGRMEKQND